MNRIFCYIAVLLLCSCQATFFSETFPFTENQEKVATIHRLDLSHQNLKWLPKEIVEYKNLHFINLSNNPELQLDSAFSVLATLPALKIIRLDSNHIEKLPENIKKLTALTHLSFVNNPQFNLNENCVVLAGMHSLTTLNFQHCAFTEIPATIASIKHLRNLRLSNNKINTGASFTHLSKIEKLKFLWLDNNEIATLPPEIGALNQVVELYLGENNLSQLPEEIKQCNNLCILYLGNNQFTAIPEQIMDMEMMYMLVLYNNQITHIPEKFSTTKSPLAVLVLDKNKLSEEEIKKAIHYFKGFFLFSTKNQQ